MGALGGRPEVQGVRQGAQGAAGGGGGHAVRCRIVQNWNRLGSYSKRIFLVHIITNNQQMANKLLHVLFPYKVSKITQH